MARRDCYTQTDTLRLVEMMRDGQSTRAIAEALRRSEHSVRVKASRMRRVLNLPRGGTRSYKLTITIGGMALQALHLHAEARGKSVAGLATELLTVIAKDDLFNAVLGEDA